MGSNPDVIHISSISLSHTHTPTTHTQQQAIHISHYTHTHTHPRMPERSTQVDTSADMFNALRLQRKRGKWEQNLSESLKMSYKSPEPAVAPGTESPLTLKTNIKMYKSLLIAAFRSLYKRRVLPIGLLTCNRDPDPSPGTEIREAREGRH